MMDRAAILGLGAVLLLSGCGTFLPTQGPPSIPTDGYSGSVPGKLQAYNRARGQCEESRSAAAKPYNKAARTRLALTISASILSALAGGAGISAFAGNNNRGLGITAAAIGATGFVLGVVTVALEPRLKSRENIAKISYDPKDRALKESNLEESTLTKLQSNTNALLKEGEGEVQRLTNIANICNSSLSTASVPPPADPADPPTGSSPTPVPPTGTTAPVGSTDVAAPPEEEPAEVDADEDPRPETQDHGEDAADPPSTPTTEPQPTITLGVLFTSLHS